MALFTHSIQSKCYLFQLQGISRPLKVLENPWICINEDLWLWTSLKLKGLDSLYKYISGYCDQCGYRHPFGNLEISQKFVAFRMFTIIPVHFPFKTTLPTKSQSDHIVVWLLTWLLSKCSTLCHNVTNHLNFFTTHSESQKSVLVVILPSWWPCYM